MVRVGRAVVQGMLLFPGTALRDSFPLLSSAASAGTATDSADFWGFLVLFQLVTPQVPLLCCVHTSKLRPRFSSQLAKLRENRQQNNACARHCVSLPSCDSSDEACGAPCMICREARCFTNPLSGSPGRTHPSFRDSTAGMPWRTSCTQTPCAPLAVQGNLPTCRLGLLCS